MKKHTIWMIIGCVIPLLLIFLAPALGINSSFSIFILLVAMFGIHLLMLKHGHGGHQHGKSQKKNLDQETSTTQNHEHNQH